MRSFCSLLAILLLIPVLALASTQDLGNGSSGQDVTELQTRLTELGLNSGSIDGIYGKQTASAVSQAQKLLIAAGYEVEDTGTADAKTLALLYDESAETALLTLRTGCIGERVKALQNRLIDLKLLSGAADGDYGSQTKAAVQSFQKRMKLEANGVAAPETNALLMSDLSQYGFKAPVFFDDSNPLALTEEYLFAPAYLLMDAVTGEVLLEKNADQRMYPASTTKIMTLLTALEYGKLDQQVTIPSSASDVPADSSLVPVYPGEEMSRLDLLYGLMIRSGNDAANAIAQLCAGSVAAFVKQMNKNARALGMHDTHFENPHGYHHKKHYSTARDLAIAARYGLTNPTFCQIVTCLNYTLPATFKREELLLTNSYEIFDPESEAYIPGAAGVKSGYTSHAGFCYVGACQRNGRTLLAVILNEPSRNRAWLDLRRLFEYGFAKTAY